MTKDFDLKSIGGEFALDAVIDYRNRVGVGYDAIRVLGWGNLIMNYSGAPILLFGFNFCVAIELGC